MYLRTNEHFQCCFQGYLTCWVESDILEMCLLKRFARSKEKDWAREIQVLSEISKHDEHPNLMRYHWHSEGKLVTSALTLVIYVNN